MTKIWDLFEPALYYAMRKEGYVREQTLDNLVIANYTEKAQYEQKWNPVTLQCRGLIYDSDTEEVVARPFPKFFNWDDSSQPYPPQGECMITPKMDGSLGILYRHNGQYRIATRGSFTSDQALHATEVLRRNQAIWAPVFSNFATYLFEIIYPENRIVVDYGETDSLVLLDVIDKETGLTRFDLFEELSWPDKVFRKVTKFSDQLVHEIPQGEEGFVLYWPYQNFRVKIKSAEYLALHKMIFGLNARMVWERMGQGETWQQICDGLPDEFHTWVRKVATDLTEERDEIVAETLRAWQRVLSKLPETYTRKDFALLAKNEPLRAYLFMLEDRKPVSALQAEVWKTLRPSGTNQIKVLSEDVA